MKKYLATTLIFYCYLSFAEEETPVVMPDLAYEDNEDIYRLVFGHVDQQEDMMFDAEVLVDGEKTGTASTFVGKICKVQAASLKNCLSDFLESEDIEVIDKCKDEDGFVEFSKLQNLPFKTKLNRLTMQVEVFLPIEKKKERSLGGKRTSYREKPNVDPANVSAVVNVRASQTTHRDKFSSITTQDLVLTPYVNLFGVCAEGAATYQKASNSNGQFRRDYLTFVYDLEEPDVMLKYGDIFSRSLSYQSPPRIWGFSVNKDVEREKSQGCPSPIRITLLKTSTIEIYSNDHLIRTRTNVAPGTYTLDDISYQRGENNIKIKIIDESGHEEVLDESFFYESSFVPKGKFTFDGSYGYPKINDAIKGRYDKENPLLSLTIRYGLLHSVELGLGLLRNKAGHTHSYEIRNRNILGHFDLKFATSNYENHGKSLAGKVFYAQYSSPSVTLIDKTNFSFSASIEKSDNFFKPYLAPQAEVFKSDEFLKKEENVKGKSTTINYHFNLSNILSFNTGFSYTQQKTFDHKSSKKMSWNISRSFTLDNEWFSTGNVSANFNRNIEFDGKKKNSFSIYCSLSLKNHVNLSSGYSRTDNGSHSYLTMSHSPENMGFSYDITAEKSKDTKNIKFNTNYSNPIFRGNLNYSRNNKRSRSINVGAESALYFADGRFAVSRTNYSDGGFVLVTPKGDIANQKIKFLNKNTESGFLGGSAVLNNSRISSSVSRIDLREIPDDISLKQDTVVSKGQYKRGFIADIHGVKSITAKGVLVDSQGEILEQVTGFAINKDNVDEPPVSFFTNSSGEFSLFELKPGKYKLTINIKNTESIDVEIKETSENETLDLGTIVCKDFIEEAENDANI